MVGRNRSPIVRGLVVGAACVQLVSGCTGLEKEHVQDRIHEVRQTGDGGYIVVAEKHYRTVEHGICFDGCEGDPISYLWVLKLDAGGAVEWERTLYRSERDTITAGGIAELATGGFVAVGLAGEEQWRTWIVRLDERGKTRWTRDDPNPIVAYEPVLVEPLPGGSAVVAGIGVEQGDGGWGVYSIVVSADGGIGERKGGQLVGSDVFQAVDLVRTSDGGFAMLCEKEAPNPGTETGYPEVTTSHLVRYGASGDISWTKDLDLARYGENHPVMVRQAPDGGLVLIATDSYGSETEVVKVDAADGAVAWEARLAMPASAMEVAGDGSLFLAGRGLAVTKVGAGGGEVWRSTGPGIGGFAPVDVDVTADGGVVVGDMSSSKVAKLDAGGSLEWSVAHGDPLEGGE